MTREEIIRMAREAGGVADDQTVVLWHEELERFAALVAAHALRSGVGVTNASSEPVAKAGAMPGTSSGFTMACFKASDVPVGTSIYTAPQPAQSKDAEWLTGCPDCGMPPEQCECDDELDSINKDAARYRWLRDTAIYIDPVQKILRISNVYIKNDGSIPISFDAAIDAAMEKK